MAGDIGNSGRNSFRGPRFFSIDMSLVKRFAITEKHALVFRAEAYNLINNVNFANPGFGKAAVALEGDALVLELQATGAKLKLDPWDGDIFTAALLAEPLSEGLTEQGGQVHNATNQGAEPVVAVATFLAPQGAALRIDEAKPDNCS